MINLIQKHPYHLVDNSPWPFAIGLASLATTTGFVIYMHFYFQGIFAFFLGFFSLIFIAFSWWKNIVSKGTFQGRHTKKVQKGLKYVMIFLYYLKFQVKNITKLKK